MAKQDALIAALLDETEQLKRRVGMNSSNSSMPPGSDGSAARAKQPKKRSPRPRGGQAGHEGHAQAWRTDPDQVTVVVPEECAGCGQRLAGIEARIAARVQVFDTPPMKLQLTEYRMVKVTCPACRRDPGRPLAGAAPLRPERTRTHRDVGRDVGLKREHEHQPVRRPDECC
ncbi:DUF6444 domain-containing protein [Nonomuraea guangzhouensis]|uniref:DUF6444 domain-containing protein n=1 Tax=Nonomuraea guangzhouensis TaxID=1291555 RepID=A0ABW4GZ49_9ACTN|nr:DUF6444 domain-containing protein [Nonomuraea guangzhouensis]